MGENASLSGLAQPHSEVSSEKRKRESGAADAKERPSQSSWLSWVLDFVIADVTLGVLCGWIFATVDIASRIGNPHTPWLRHVIGVLPLYALWGTAFGLMAGLVNAAEQGLVRRIGKTRPRIARSIRGALYAGLAALCVWSTAFWMFSGGRVQATNSARWGPWAVVAAVAVGAFVLTIATEIAARGRERGRIVFPAAFAILGAAGVAALLYIDLHVYVALYARLHTLAEAMAAVIVLCVLASLGHQRLVYGRGRKIGAVFSVLGLSWLFTFVVWAPPRNWLAKDLRHVWLEPIYAGRMLARAQETEAYLANPSGYKGAGFVGIDRLKEHYDISTSLSPIWQEPPPEPPAFRSRLEKLRTAKKPNVIVYYVDTLRADVAGDLRVMPHLGEFNQEGLQFVRAYASGSDTSRSLPALTSGRYKPDAKDVNIVETARRHGYKTVLVIPQSAHEFLQKEVKNFRFEESEEILDYATVRTDVWGYGADRPSAGKIVDQSLEWLSENKQEHFFLWAFNFDQHNWREINDRHIAESAQRFAMPMGTGRARYEVVARSIDEEFGRLLKGVDDLGLSDNTIVVFVSDHGEGLGRDGFWVHSIFLWEALVRVPLTIRIPGVEPKVVWEQVSLVDVAPTLARFIDPKVDTSSYQGDDLLGYVFADRPPRKRPILMEAGTHDGIRRIGMIEPRTPFKLVLQLESGVPELYDVGIDDPDWNSIAEENSSQTLSMLNRLVRSPLFPRKDDQKE